MFSSFPDVHLKRVVFCRQVEERLAFFVMEKAYVALNPGGIYLMKKEPRI